MLKTEILTVELPEELVAVIRSAVHDGEYRSDDEAVCDALQTWKAQRNPHDEDTAHVRIAVKEAGDHGVYVPMDEVFDRLEAKYQAMVEAETNAKR